MTNTTVHIINHTHWDREWFLTSIYTTEWIPGLIERLEELVAKNPDFHYLLDGQTLIVEDLLAIRSEYAERVRKLVSAGNLIIGPYYCQPDWQLTGGETLFRNLEYGLEITKNFGGEPGIGWMVDTFGHISQSPQIHRHFGIDTVYVWRGVPQLKPYFNWQGAGGHELFAINLFGGYRNLYGVTHAPTIGEIRLQKEADRLQPYYPTADVPLFDGYDLEDNPEDPVRWFAGRNQLAGHIDLVEATPASFAATMRPKLTDIPQICGELNSGKFGATFPGTFSTRAYLKLLGHDCEHLLYQVVEPLATMALANGESWSGELYKQWSKTILQNAVHDAICGVSIDQVHEKMEYSYRQIFGEMTAEIERLLPKACTGFSSGKYVVSTCAQPVEKWLVQDGKLHHIYTGGMGVAVLDAGQKIDDVQTPVGTFAWANEHYEATVSSDGVLEIGGSCFGQIQISAERGDTYSDETQEIIGMLEPDGSLVVEQTAEDYAVVAYTGRCEFDEGEVSAKISFTFDPSALVGVSVELDSRGTNFHAEIVFATGLTGDIWAGMPLDRVKRSAVDTDLMPRVVDEEMSKILMGQRELNGTRTFPMHGFVGRSTESNSAYVFSRGNRSYRSWEDGQFAISLRRSVEWVTEGNLQNRIGDAGPFFYVPDARCERPIRHEMAVYVGDISPSDSQFDTLENSFQHTPLIVDVVGVGTATNCIFCKSDQPLSAVFPDPAGGNQIVGRKWHATGANKGRIETESLFALAELDSIDDQVVSCHLLNKPVVRIGHNQGLPDQAIVDELKAKIEVLKVSAADARQRMAGAVGNQKLRVEHEVYVHERELHEFLLSAKLNELKIAQAGKLDYAYLYELDPDIADIGFKLNQLRIKRRIFDYVVTAI
ncbi:MAG: alpha-mannosidase [Cellvibrionaceae bacterium]|jgi:alpha-mannosidase